MSGDYPMGQGTRAHAMALFVILNSPMTMLPDSPSEVMIYSVDGKSVFNQQACSGKMPISMANFNPGLYLAEISSMGQTVVKKILKE